MNNFFSEANLSNGQDRRQAAFAGTWYESDPNRLRSQIKRFRVAAEEALEREPSDTSLSPSKPIEGAVLAVVAPHAGYIFSGQTAAFSFESAAKSRNVKRVFLLGPSHYASFSGIALPTEKVFATPLGDLLVDSEVVEQLKMYPGFAQIPDVHKSEHALEMQLPFIKEAFSNVTIVPMLVGAMQDLGDIMRTAHMLRRYIKPDDLIVVSSDFTHYGPRYRYLPFHRNIRENVRKIDKEAFDCLKHANLADFLAFREKTNDTICGFYPCAILLATLPDGSHGTLLNYRTSQDTAPEDQSNSVSYLSIAFSSATSPSGWSPEEEEKEEEQTISLSEAEKTALLKIARHALELFVRENKRLSAAHFEPLITPIMNQPMGVFVTLYKRKIVDTPSKRSSREHKTLRGCIGYIFPVKPLVESVIESAIGSASRDYRFDKVTPNELEDLLIDIHVLTPPKRIDSHEHIKIGRDGVLMYKQGHQSVFLPSVATEFGWTIEETLSQLSIKAGLAKDAWKQHAYFDTFQTISFEED